MNGWKDCQLGDILIFQRGHDLSKKQMVFGKYPTLDISVPPLPEQVEIGRTLRALDDKIANNTKINHHLASPRSATKDKGWSFGNHKNVRHSQFATHCIANFKKCRQCWHF
jgi:restriction endonuclease S subunit